MSCGCKDENGLGRNAAGAGAGANARAVVPPTVGNVARTIATGDTPARDLLLKKGSYKVVSNVPFAGEEPVFLTDVEKAIDIGGELKRIYFHKIELDNIREPEPGKKTARQVIEYTLLDNPVPVAPVVASASIIGTGRQSPGIEIESVEQFSNFDLQQIALTAGAVASFVLVVWQLTK